VVIVVVKQHRGQSPTHVPLDVVSQHARKDVCPYSVGQPMVDRLNFQVDRFEAAECSLDGAQALVVGDRLLGRLEQPLALAGSLVGQQRIAAKSPRPSASP